jgi:hypothetical protein
MEIKPVAAAAYSMNKGTEFAYELTYDLEGCKGYKVRAVVMADGMMRVEGNTGKEWKSNKPYIVKKNKKRQGERVVEKVKTFLAA